MKRALTALLAMIIASPLYATVKQSSSGICHSPESPYYERTKSYKPFSTLEACLHSGGRLSKKAETTTPKQHTGNTRSYSRDQFGHGWADNDRDCQDSRQEALIAQSTGQLRFKTGRGCRVMAGRWISPFTSLVIHDPGKIDIDHVVPLKWAWDHGANSWPQPQREKFANDGVNLISVEASLNRQKGAKALDQWLPPTNQCQYVVRFLRIQKSYGLKLSSSETARFKAVRQKACV
ncbi:HNH endonuclease family protein [Neptunomonas antarctica]|uniref:GmrSD restriction endonucleases C-terminal domain-containing protein n=1 Tax=Neptunomonas antarctica TaxID=619304 RepID=A0A1N7L8L3_9GAMM|nr:HNH endonuclease family protein [Neptunomonas antarctica]SIS70178.1 Protein of unknown function [Neptunomonas antarctica]